MSERLLRELPGDLPSFLKRFGTDAKCRAYLVRELCVNLGDGAVQAAS